MDFGSLGQLRHSARYAGTSLDTVRHESPRKWCERIETGTDRRGPTFLNVGACRSPYPHTGQWASRWSRRLIGILVFRLTRQSVLKVAESRLDIVKAALVAKAINVIGNDLILFAE